LLIFNKEIEQNLNQFRTKADEAYKYGDIEYLHQLSTQLINMIENHVAFIEEKEGKRRLMDFAKGN
tara:strand:+ start:67 stop:264 length:198 start_codon:yes stop_codon:yes gene_type:complete